MSDADDDRLEWRETYFVLFDENNRPDADRVHAALSDLRGDFEIKNLSADDEGRFESVTVLSPQNHAALEITYLNGDDIREQSQALEKELKSCATDRAKLARMKNYSARFDVMHFETMSDDVFDDGEEMFDPSALLIVVESLARLTDGIAVDPASGMML